MVAVQERGPAVPRRTAFVLTGGGSLGAVQVGMMAALHDHGVVPDVLVGTSVGAVNAAHLAGPGPWSDRVGELTELWLGLRRSDVFALDPRRWARLQLRAPGRAIASARLPGSVRRKSCHLIPKPSTR